jgi:hypothetical protein
MAQAVYLMNEPTAKSPGRRSTSLISRRFASQEICDVCSAIIMAGQHIIERIAPDRRLVRLHVSCLAPPEMPTPRTWRKLKAVQFLLLRCSSGRRGVIK